MSLSVTSTHENGDFIAVHRHEGGQAVLSLDGPALMCEIRDQAGNVIASEQLDAEPKITPSHADPAMYTRHEDGRVIVELSDTVLNGGRMELRSDDGNDNGLSVTGYDADGDAYLQIYATPNEFAPEADTTQDPTL